MFKDLFDKVINAQIEPISGYDAAFIYSETPKSPMHIASLTVVEGSLDYEEFKTGVANKLHLMERFRQRLVNVPFNVDYPFWADDPNFDIDLHVQHIRLPEPGDWSTLRKLTASIFSAPLDLRRPLWSIHFIEGITNIDQVPKDSVAILAKVHHVMIDGMSGVGVMGLLFSFTPESKQYEDEKPVPFQPQPLPNDITLLAKSYIGFLKNPLRVPRIAGKAMFNIMKSRAAKKMAIGSEAINPAYPVPHTIFNGHISPKRLWGTAIISLDRVKVLKKTMEVTINDIFLAICSGAIRKYLLEKDKLPSQPLVANVPVSVRSKESAKDINNQISNMMIPIATHVEDPIERLEMIQEQTIQGKIRHQALGANTLAEMANAVPFGLANLAAGVYSRYNLNELHRPPFNVTISNVPGPQIPLYLNGRKVDSILGLTPVVDGFGLIIAIFSYNGKVSITATSDAKTMPDIDVFARYLRESANDLESVILERGKVKKKVAKKVHRTHSFLNKIKKHFKDHPRLTKKISGIYQLEIRYPEKIETWQIDLRAAPAKIGKRPAKTFQAKIFMDEKYLTRIMKGKLSWEEAQVQGRIKLEGKQNRKEILLMLLNKITK